MSEIRVTPDECKELGAFCEGCEYRSTCKDLISWLIKQMMPKIQNILRQHSCSCPEDQLESLTRELRQFFE